MVSALGTYSQESKLRRYFLSAIAKSISDDKFAKLRAQFLNLNAEQGGSVSGSQVREALMNVDVPACDVDDILKAIDVDHDGEVAFSDFMAAALSAEPDFSDETLQLVFRNFDVDKKDRITPENLREVLGDSFDPDDVVDDKGMGFKEFCDIVRQPTRRMPKAIHGKLKKLKGDSNRDPSKKGYIGLRDRLAYQERYVVISRLQLRWWKTEGTSGASSAIRIVDLVENDCVVVRVPDCPSRFLLRSKAGSWIGESLHDVEEGRDFVFDANGSSHGCDKWMEALEAHVAAAQNERALRRSGSLTSS